MRAVEERREKLGDAIHGCTHSATAQKKKIVKQWSLLGWKGTFGGAGLAGDVIYFGAMRIDLEWDRV